MLYLCLDGSFFLVFDFAFTKLKTRPIAFLPFWAFCTTPYVANMMQKNIAQPAIKVQKITDCGNLRAKKLGETLLFCQGF